MDFAINKGTIRGLLALAVSLLSMAHYANAEIPCSDPVCVGMPQVTKGAANGTYFSGPIDVAVDIQDDASTGTEREIFFSTDAGATWSDTPYFYSTKKTSFIDDPELTRPSSAQFLQLKDGRYLVTWVDINRDMADAPDPESVYKRQVHRPGVYNIMVRIYNPDGTPFSNVMNIETQNGPWYYFNDLQVKYINNNIIVAWHYNNNIFAKIFNDNGDLVRDKFQLNTSRYVTGVNNQTYDITRRGEFTDERSYAIETIEGANNGLMVVYGSDALYLSDKTDITTCKDYEAISAYNRNACSFYFAKIIDDNGSDVVPEFNIFPGNKYKDINSIHVTALKGVNEGKMLVSYGHIVRDPSLAAFSNGIPYTGALEHQTYLGRELQYKIIESNGSIGLPKKIRLHHSSLDPRVQTRELPDPIYITRPSYAKTLGLDDGGFALVYKNSWVGGFRYYLDAVALTSSKGIIPFLTFGHVSELYYSRFTSQFFQVPAQDYGYGIPGKILEETKFNTSTDDINVAGDRFALLEKNDRRSHSQWLVWPWNSGKVSPHLYYRDANNFKLAKSDNAITIAFNSLLYTNTAFSSEKLNTYINYTSDQCHAISCPYKGNNYITIDNSGAIVARHDDYALYSDLSGATIIEDYGSESNATDTPFDVRKNLLSDIQYIGNDLLYVKQKGIANIYDHRAGEYLDFGKLSLMSVSPGALKQKTYDRLVFRNDVNLQFKVIDRATGQEYLSPVKRLIYVDPSDGADGSINYPDGYTRNLTSTVGVNMTCQTCDVLELYERTAAMSQGMCGTYGPWLPVGGTTATDVNRTVYLTNALCYQYKASVSNTMLGFSHEYTSSNTIKVDDSIPSVSVSSSLAFDALSITVQQSDAASGISSSTYALNDGDPVSFTGQDLNLTVADGLNRVHIVVTDRAGNAAQVDHFVTADLTPPQIRIIGIEEGGVYSSDLSLLYTMTQELTNVVVTVDGNVVTDVKGLAEGPHVLSVSGTAPGGGVVTETVSFTIDSNAFSFQLLSPQDREYLSNNLTIQYDASKPLSNLSYTLNGGRSQSDLDLRNLSDGSYHMVLTATSKDGDIESTEVNFTVHQAVPGLVVTSPANNVFYSTNTVPLNYSSDSAVTLQLDGQSISPNSTGLTLTKDGDHELIVTATHPVSRNTVSRVIKFGTDSVLPNVQLLSPEASRIYANGDIPIDYKTNKPLNNVVYQLNGTPVRSLNKLGVGSHTFTLVAQDQAGRVIKETVNFEVATLDIVRPISNEQIISNIFPPAYELEYQAKGNFTGYTMALDDNQQSLLSPSQGPGTVIPLVAAPGNHDLTVRGNINSQQVGRRVSFNLGAKNVSVGPGSINYVYTNCDQDFNNCDVIAQLKVRNSGQHDITTPFMVRLDHIDQNGYESFPFYINSLKSKAETRKTTLPFKASLGDILTVNVDPNSELENELAADNSYSVEFSAGKITNVDALLSSKNTYFEGVSAFNLVTAKTVGPVDRIQYRINGWVFEKNAPNENSEGEFTSVVDMGLLDSNSPCIEIRAISETGVTLDVELKCFKVSSLNVTGLTKYMYNWSLHQSQHQFVLVDNIDAKVMMEQASFLRAQSLSAPASIMAELKEDRKVKYRFNYDPGAVKKRLEEKNLKWAEDGFLNGNVALPNGQTVVVTTIDTEKKACEVDGAVPITMPDRVVKVNELYAEELNRINASASVIDDMTIGEKLLLKFFNSYGFPYYWVHDLYTVENFFGDLTGSDAVEEGFKGFRENNGIANFLSSFLDLKITNISWVHGHVPENPGSIAISGNYVNKFYGDRCLLVDIDDKTVGLRIEGYYDWGLDDVSINLSTNTVRIGLLNYSYLSLGVPFTPSSLHYPLLLADIEFQIDPINMSIPIDYGARLGIKIIGDDLEQFGPFHTRFSLSMKHHQRLAKLDIAAYPILLHGLGVGVDYNLYIDLDGQAKFDLIAARDYDDEFIYLVDYDASASLYKRKKICFLGRCHHRGWKLDRIVWSRPKRSENIPFGAPYTQQDVDGYLRSVGATWVR